MEAAVVNCLLMEEPYVTQFVSDLTQIAGNLGLVAVVVNSACRLAAAEEPVVDLIQKPLDLTQMLAWDCLVLVVAL